MLEQRTEAGPFLASPTQTSHGGGPAGQTEPMRPGSTLGTRYRIVALAGPDWFGAIGGLAAMAGIWFADDAFVKAGQSVPLS